MNTIMNTIMNTTRLHKWTIMLALVLVLAITSTSSAFMEDAVGHWLLDDNEPDSTVLDDSCNYHDGTFYDANGPADTNDHAVDGKLGGALHFDAGDEDHIRVPSHSDFEFDEYDAFSIAVWIRNDGVAPYGQDDIVAKINSVWQGYFVAIDDDDTVYFRISETEHVYFIRGYGTTDVADGEWHHVVCTYDGSASYNGMLVYVDGSEDDTDVWGDLWEGSAANSEPLCFAARYNNGVSGCYFNGDLDDVSIYSKELSASEVNELWNDGNGLPYPSCWNYLTQCHADSDGDGDVDLTDFYVFKDSFGTDYWNDWNNGAGPYNPCADYDRDGDGDLTDFFIFQEYFGEPNVPADCNCGGVWPPE